MTTPADARSTTRPWVDAFADEMEKQLDNNREKGDRAGWSKESKLWLLSRLQAEVAELAEALDWESRTRGGPMKAIRMRAVVCEAADIANFAMMIADVAGGLRPKP